MLFSGRVSVRVMIRFSVWLVSGYAHVCMLRSVVIVTLPLTTVRFCRSVAILKLLKYIDLWASATVYY